MSFTHATRLLGAALCCAATGCLSPLSPNEPPLVRYYRPALPGPSEGHAPKGRGPLALIRVRAAPHLREPIVWRTSEVEYAFDEQHQWVVPPDVLVADALETILYGEAGFRPDDGTGPALEVHVESFERGADGAVVELSAVLSTHDAAPERRTIRITRPVADDEASTLARAIGAALHEAALELAAFAAS